MTDLDEGEMERRKTAQEERRLRQEQEETPELERQSEREQKNFETIMAAIARTGDQGGHQSDYPVCQIATAMPVKWGTGHSSC